MTSENSYEYTQLHCFLYKRTFTFTLQPFSIRSFYGYLVMCYVNKLWITCR